MNATEVRATVDAALEGRRLLAHPFYRRWENAELSMSELTSYAEQYRHFEAALPNVLANILGQLPSDSAAHSFVQDNFDDETGSDGRASHLELFNGFMKSVDGTVGAEVSPAMQSLLDAYATVASQGVGSSLGGLIAYEHQSSEVAASKGDGLRKHYGLSTNDTKFWDVHATLDVDHADWAMEAVATLDVSADEITNGVTQIAEAWWKFLDEREALAPVAA